MCYELHTADVKAGTAVERHSCKMTEMAILADIQVLGRLCTWTEVRTN
jgi:hypothetical protein